MGQRPVYLIPPILTRCPILFNNLEHIPLSVDYCIPCFYNDNNNNNNPVSILQCMCRTPLVKQSQFFNSPPPGSSGQISARNYHKRADLFYYCIPLLYYYGIIMVLPRSQGLPLLYYYYYVALQYGCLPPLAKQSQFSRSPPPGSTGQTSATNYHQRADLFYYCIP